MSSVHMLRDRSSAIMTSRLSLKDNSSRSPHCGRANATIPNAAAAMTRYAGATLRGAAARTLLPVLTDTRRIAGHSDLESCRVRRASQAAATGSSSANSIQGFPQLMRRSGVRLSIDRGEAVLQPTRQDLHITGLPTHETTIYVSLRKVKLLSGMHLVP